ncbi:MAG TPA: AsmA family protein [Ramlibacter sp.]|nr:AsmA family protein [Ramlibacter sp.]
MTSVWIRRLAIAVGALALVLVAATAVLLATFDANRYKALAIEWMRTEHQRTLEIDGPIKLSFFPRLSVQVSRVRLSERGRSDEFAAIGEAALAVQVLPLLRKQLVIGRVSARDVHAAYLRDARGARNIDDLVSRNAAPDAGASPSGGPAMHFDVSGVELDNLRLQVRDEVARLAGDLEVLSFSSGRLANQAESPVSLRATALLTQPEALKLSVDGRTTLMLDLDRNSVALSRMKLDVTGETASVKALSLALEGALAWDGGALRAGPLQVTLKGATLGTTSLTPSTLQVKRALLNLAGKRLELESLDLALAGRRGADPFEVSIRWPRLAVDGRKVESSPLSGRVKVAGQSGLEGQIRSAAPTGSFDALRVPGLELTLAGSSGQRKIDGTAKADMLIDAGRGAATFERVDLHATLADPGLQPLKLVVQGSGGADTKAATWKLNGSINANRFETSGHAAFAGKVPEIKVTARFDDLDMNTLLAPGKPAPVAPRSTAPADTPVVLEGLKAVNGQFTLDAAALAFRQYKVADAKVNATLDKGILRIAQFSGRAWGGHFQASSSADANSHRVAIRLDAKGVNVNALLKNVADKDLLEGTGHVVADLNSSGASVGALRSNLAGTAALDVRDGAIKGINLARSLREAQAALSLKQDTTTRASGVEKTDFSELRASARIAGGVARSDDLDLKSPFLRIGGAGRFDIGQGRIDYTARAKLTPTAVGQGGTGLEALRGIEVPVALSGPFDAIDWKIQWSGVAEAAVRNTLKEKLAESIGAKLGAPPPRADAASAPTKPKDVLKDTLKGLFK